MIKVKDFKFKFIISIVLVILSMSIFMPFISFATVDTTYLDPKQFDDSLYSQASDFSIGGDTVGGIITKFLGRLLTVLRIIAVGWAVVMAISIAVKYMSGDNQIKAQLKTDMPTYLIGAVILFGSAGLMTLIQYLIDDKLVV